jgi:hypothetical protein
MGTFFAVLTAVYLAVGIGSIVYNERRSPQRRHKLADQFAQRVDLRLTPDVEPQVTEELIRRRRYNQVGWTVGVAVGMPLIALADRNGFGPFRGFTVVVFLFVPATVCGAAAHLRSLSRRPQAAARVAHARSTTVSDYLNPLELYLLRALALVPAALTAAWAVIPRKPDAEPLWDPSLGSAAALSAGVVALLVVTEISLRALLRAPQPAESTQQLAFDDALRAQAMRDLFTLPMIGAINLSAYLWVVIADTARWRFMPGIAQLIPQALLLLAFGYLALYYSKPVQTRYRQRLWNAAPTDAQVTGR